MQILGENETAAAFTDAAHQRQEAVNTLMYDEASGVQCCASLQGAARGLPAAEAYMHKHYLQSNDVLDPNLLRQAQPQTSQSTHAGPQSAASRCAQPQSAQPNCAQP